MILRFVANVDLFPFLFRPPFLRKERDFKKKFFFLKISKIQGKVFVLEPFLKKIYLLSLSNWQKYQKRLNNIDYLKEKLTLPEDFRILHFVLAPHCNLKCQYCIDLSFKRKPAFLSFSQFKAAVDFLAKSKKPVGVSFVSSGEPTLNFPLLKKAIPYIKKRLKLKRLEISTNGVLNSKKDLLWLAKNFQILQISCDGPPEIQDKVRPLKNGGKSSPFVEKTIKILVKEKKNFKVACTISSYSLYKEKKILGYFLSLGVKDVTFRPVYSLGGGEKILKEGNFLKKILKSLFILKELSDFLGKNFDITPTYIFDTKTLFACPVGACLVVTPSSKIFACSLLAGKEDFKFQKNAKKLVIGKINEKTKKVEINFKKVKKLRELRLKSKECEKCDYKFCFGGCFLTNSFTKDKVLINKENCLRHRLSFSFLGKYLLEKNYFQIFPHFEEKKGKLYLNFLFFKLNCLNKKEIFFLKLDLEKEDYGKRKKEIKKWAKGKIFKIVLISPTQKNSLDKKRALDFYNFLLFLEKNLIPFKITKPITFSFEASKIEEKLLNKFLIPRNCYQCLEMFLVKNKKLVFCNKIKSKINLKKATRFQIYKIFKKRALSFLPCCPAFFNV